VIDRAPVVGSWPQRGLRKGAGTPGKGEGRRWSARGGSAYGVDGPQVTLPLRPPLPELLGQRMPSPENQHCEGGPYDVPTKDPDPGEPAQADLRQGSLKPSEPELEQEKRERRAHDQAGLALRPHVTTLTATTPYTRQKT